MDKTLEFPGSPLPLDSKLYIKRPPVETRLCQEITKPGSLVRIKAPKRMGKSSLLIRLIHQAETLGYSLVTIDFQEADIACFENLDRLLHWFSIHVSQQLKLKPQLEQYWDQELGSKVSCTIYFEHYLLEQLNAPIVLILNEVNRVFEYPKIAQDFLALLRFWYERAKYSQLWQKLRLVMAHSTEIYVSLKIEQSPFNVGLPLKLLEFTVEQVQELISHYGLEGCDRTLAKSLMQIVGGHPYLVNLALYHLRRRDLTLEHFLQNAASLTGIYSDHLRSCWVTLQKRPKLLTALQQLMIADSPLDLDPIIAYELDSMGLVKITNDSCQLSCELYRLYFKEKYWNPVTLNALRIQQLEQENRQLRDLANTDALTQIPNRRFFDDYLQAEWKRMKNQASPLSLILCDIDHFKSYNDTYGHLMGDECIKEIARLVDKMAQYSGYVAARYGGEEFAIILPETHAIRARKLAETVRSHLKTFIHQSHLPPVTLSFGIASFIPSTNISSDELISAADQALYQSKQMGRDRITLSSTF